MRKLATGRKCIVNSEFVDVVAAQRGLAPRAFLPRLRLEATGHQTWQKRSGSAAPRHFTMHYNDNDVVEGT